MAYPPVVCHSLGIGTMKVFILLSLVAVAFATRECGENSHYDSCGTACPVTCENYENPPKVCVLMCNPGCHCDEGYVKTADGRCVAPEECPAKQALNLRCGANAHFEGCGTACPLTCENYENPPKICNMMCKIGCQCNKGYVQAKDGSCVKPEECPANAEQALNMKCGANAHYELCGTDCPLTCKNYKDAPLVCDFMCWRGCQCDKGYVQDEDGTCVRPEECPAESVEVCGENQVFTTCDTACPLTCDNYQDPPKMCTLQCIMRCACEKGFVKTRDGRCVRPEECPASAPEQKTCLGEAETGMCRGYFPMWYYDVKSEKCKKFIYGGCGGNGNRYSTEEECMNHCGDVLNEAPETDLCELPAVTGMCRAYFRRFYYNEETGQCEKFVYGGCGGNANNFKTVEDCEARCGQNA